MRFTTGWARVTEAEYKKWLGNITSGTKIMFQRFLPLDPVVLGVQAECWSFCNAEFTGGETHEGELVVRPEFRPETIYIDPRTGLSTFMNSEHVFQPRIIPWHGDIQPSGDSRLFLGHYPVYEPDYQTRCQVFISDGKGFSKNRRLTQKTWGRTYIHGRDVNGGAIVFVFLDVKDKDETLKAWCTDKQGIDYLYSEDVGNR